MRILINELKKLLSWKIILLMIILNSICFFLFIEFYITHFPNGRPALDSYNVAVEMLDTYGINVNEDEFEDFKGTYERRVNEAEVYLQSRDEFVDLGIVSYEDFRSFEQDDERSWELSWSVYEENNVFWELQAREYIIDWYESKEESVEGWTQNESVQQRERLNELKEAGQFKIFPSEAFGNFKEFIFNVAIAVALSVVLVISPIFLKDRSRRVVDLHYSTKKGRNVYKTKIAAGFIATFIVISTLLFIYLSIYSLNKTSIFFDVPINLFIDGPTWYDLTFFEYIVLSVLAVYGIGFIFALLSMAFSSIMPNYIALIGIQIPFVVAMFSYGLHYMLRNIISLWGPKWAVPTLYSSMIVISTLIMIMMWQRERKRDIIK